MNPSCDTCVVHQSAEETCPLVPRCRDSQKKPWRYYRAKPLTTEERIRAIAEKYGAPVMLSYHYDDPTNPAALPEHLRMPEDKLWHVWIGLSGRKGILSGASAEEVLAAAEEVGNSA